MGVNRFVYQGLSLTGAFICCFLSLWLRPVWPVTKRLQRSPCGILARFLWNVWLAETAARAADLEGEFVVADPDLVTVGKVRGGLDRLPLDLDTVGRPQIDDHEARSRVHDRGVVAADVGVVEDDFVVVVSPDPGGGGTQLMELSGRVPQPGNGGNLRPLRRALLLLV